MKNNYIHIDVIDDIDNEILEDIKKLEEVKREQKYQKRRENFNKVCDYIGYIITPVFYLTLGITVFALNIAALPLLVPIASLEQYLTGDNYYFMIYRDIKGCINKYFNKNK